MECLLLHFCIINPIIYKLKFKTMTTEQNKTLVRRVNKEFIEGGNMNIFNEIFAEDFVNHTAPPGSPIF
jgi:hypothetical protein